MENDIVACSNNLLKLKLMLAYVSDAVTNIQYDTKFIESINDKSIFDEIDKVLIDTQSHFDNLRNIHIESPMPL